MSFAPLGVLLVFIAVHGVEARTLEADRAVFLFPRYYRLGPLCKQ